MSEETKDARQLLADITAGLEGVTPGPWQAEAYPNLLVDIFNVVGPSNVVCGLDGIASADRSNDRTFDEDAANMRHIARCDPEAMQAIADLVAEQDRRIAELEAERQWQPIETAPKDGTPFIGAYITVNWADSPRRGDIVKCWWQPEFEAFISSCRVMRLHNGHTFEDGSTQSLHSPVFEEVSHWMPLPASPHEGTQS